MNLNIKSNPIPDEIEKYIISKSNLKAPQSYGPISDLEINRIKDKVNLKFSININPRIIGSIKVAWMKNYIIDNFYKLRKFSNKIIQLYPKIGVIELSAKYDISPMTLIRFIFEVKYKTKLSQLLKSSTKLNSYDQNELEIATNSDIYSQLDQGNQEIEANEFELKIENILIKHKIKYQTQADLTKIQIRTHGHAFNTPDFAILSDLTINNLKINWIDAKNFYGSNTKFIKSKIQKQILKYIKTYGSGLIVFSLGHNEKLKFDHTLILDYEQILKSN